MFELRDVFSKTRKHTWVETFAQLFWGVFPCVLFRVDGSSRILWSGSACTVHSFEIRREKLWTNSCSSIFQHQWKITGFPEKPGFQYDNQVKINNPPPPKKKETDSVGIYISYIPKRNISWDAERSERKLSTLIKHLQDASCRSLGQPTKFRELNRGGSFNPRDIQECRKMRGGGKSPFWTARLSYLYIYFVCFPCSWNWNLTVCVISSLFFLTEHGLRVYSCDLQMTSANQHPNIKLIYQAEAANDYRNQSRGW